MVKLGHFSELATDPQAWANGYVEEVTMPNGRKEIMPSTPIEMDSVGTVPTPPAPAIGADTDEILAELGYTAEEIEQMKNIGAVKTALKNKQ
jgi:crotonobetainyl-CoA:carnitine CoA-transferase CaiB-like acyl-CoA transferase